MALCRRKFIDFWFPPVDVGNISQYFAVAKAVCERCPVWKMCLQEGMSENWGMWGGLQPNEIKAITNGGPNLRPHGTITRFRQGCSCDSCTAAHKEPLPPLDMNLIPGVGEDVDVAAVKVSVLSVLS